MSNVDEEESDSDSFLEDFNIDDEEAEEVEPLTPTVAMPLLQAPPAPERGFVRQNAVRFENEGAESMGVEGAEPLVEGAESMGVEGAEPLAQPLVDRRQLLIIGATSINRLPANFSFEPYDLKMFEGEVLDYETLRYRYDSEDNHNGILQQVSMTKLNPVTNLKVFVGLNLFGKDLTGFNFDNKTFISCIFIKANLSKVSMRNAVLYDCHCQEIIATDANLSGSLLYECNFFNADFKNAVMKNLYCKYPDDEQYVRWPSIVDIMASENLILPERNTLMIQFQQSDLTNTIFDDSLLDEVDFVNANLKNTSMRNCSLVKATFNLAKLNEANFTNAKCLEADFSEANCTQACFNNANLMNANCKDGYFIYCDFRRSKLQKCDFTGAGAYLSYSIFQNCQADNIGLTNARLYNCFFSNNSMDESDCRNAKFTGSIIINTSLNDANFIEANCCNVSFTGSQLNNVNFESAILFKTTFVNCTINNAHLNRAFISEELIANFRAIGVINDATWQAPTEPPPNEAEVCQIPTIEVPVYNLTGEEEGQGQPNTNFAQPISESFEEGQAPSPPVNAQQSEDLEDENRWYWSPKPERVAETVHPEDNEEEEEAPIEDAVGNRIRMPEERDGAVYRSMFTDNKPESLRFMNFKNCNFEGYDFSDYHDLTGTSFFGCNLIDAIFAGCLLKDTNFQWADIINADFSDAFFRGDYDAGGLLEGATIMNCVFDGTSFNGQDRSDVYNDTTYVQPYDPKPYPDEDLLIAPVDVINSNLKGTVKSDNEEIQETEKKIQDFLTTPQNMVFRVVDYETSFNDFLVEENYVRKFLVNDSSVVFPCRKPFNIPGPSYPGPNETSYHDITRPFVNVGIILSKRVWVQKDKFMTALNTTLENNRTHPETKKGLVFFKGENAETVPTFVSKPVLSDGASWVSNLHCNSGAEKETLWFVKVVDIVADELPAEAMPIDQEDMSAFDIPAEEEDAPAFQGEYIDPYADESDSDSEAPAPVVAYNPPADNRTVSIPLPEPLFDINNATGKITRMSHFTKNAQGENVPISPEKKTMTVLNSLENIEQQINNSATATIVLIIKDERGINNYVIKFNDLIELFSNNRQDYVPCKKVAGVNPNEDIVYERRLVNIGAIINKQIFIDKRQLMELFPNKNAVSAAKKKITFYLQFNENSEKIPGVTKFNLPVRLCKEPAVTVWDLQQIKNNFYRVNDVVKLLMPEEHAGELFKIVPIPALDSLAAMPDITIENGKIFKTIDGEKIRHYFIKPLDQESPPILTPASSIEKEEQPEEPASRALIRDIIAGDTVYGHDSYLGDFQGTVIPTPEATTDPARYTTIYFQSVSYQEDQVSFQDEEFQGFYNIRVIDGKIFANDVRHYLVQLVSSISGYENSDPGPRSFPELRPATQIHLDDGFKVGDIVVGEDYDWGKFEGTILQDDDYAIDMVRIRYNGHIYYNSGEPGDKKREYLVRIDRSEQFPEDSDRDVLLFESDLTLKNLDEPDESVWPPASPESPPPPPEILFNDGDLVRGIHNQFDQFEGTISNVDDYLENYELPYNNDAHEIRARIGDDGHLYFGDELQYFVSLSRIGNNAMVMPDYPVPIAAVDIELRNSALPPQGSSQNSSEEEEEEPEEEEEEETDRSSEESIQSEEAPRQARAPFVLPPNPVPIDESAPEPILPENDPYRVGNSVMFDPQNRQPPNLNSYNIVAAGSNQSDRAMLHLREPVEGLFDPVSSWNEFYYYRVLRESGFLRNSAGQYFKNGERYIFLDRAGAASAPSLVNVKDVVLPESMVGGIGIVKLRGHNNTLRKHFRHNMNNTLRKQLYKKKSRQL